MDNPNVLDDVIDLETAAPLARVTPQALANACRRGRLVAKYVGGIWITTRAAASSYQRGKAGRPPTVREPATV